MEWSRKSRNVFTRVSLRDDIEDASVVAPQKVRPPYFDSGLSAIIFITSVGSYDQFLEEEPEVNRLHGFYWAISIDHI
jgi:hypothetical protein